MTTRQTPELVPATERQAYYLAGLAVHASPDPMRRLVELLDGLDGITLDDREREDGFLCKQRASEIITELKKQEN